MIKAGIIGLGWWGKTLVDAVAGSDKLKIVAGATRTVSPETEEFAKGHGLEIRPDLAAMLDDPEIDAIVLSTPHPMNLEQIEAAAASAKHIFCEKPLSLTKVNAERAIGFVEKAGITIGLGYNRRFHPVMIDMAKRIDEGSLGILEHFECTMAFPNALSYTDKAWRFHRDLAPCGGLTPLGVHTVDAAIDLFGEVEAVFCQSTRRAAEIDNDDTTSILFKMKNGVTGYLSTLTATSGLFRFQVFGSKGWMRADGMTHLAGASSEERRTHLFGACEVDPIGGDNETWQAEAIDLPRAALESFAEAAAGDAPFPISHQEMIHGAAVTEAIIKSSETGNMEKVG